jgi:hypothetical protein
MLDRVFSLLRVNRKLIFGKNATLVTTSATGAETSLDLAELAALNNLSATELGYLDGVTAGTALASKAVVLDSSKDVTGVRVMSGTAAAQGVDATLKGGTSSTSGNAGGAAKLTGGTPGATGVGGAASLTGAAGGATSGKGGAVTATAGAGTAGNGDGGSVILTAGAKHGSGLDGGIFQRATTYFRKQAAPGAGTDQAEVLTAAMMINGIFVHTVATGRTLTTPTGAQISAGCPTDLAVGDSFDFSVITVGTGADDISTLTAGDGNVTFVGNVTVGPDASTFNGYGTWRFRNTGTSTWVGYRIG